MEKYGWEGGKKLRREEKNIDGNRLDRAHLSNYQGTIRLIFLPRRKQGKRGGKRRKIWKGDQPKKREAKQCLGRKTGEVPKRWRKKMGEVKGEQKERDTDGWEGRNKRNEDREGKGHKRNKWEGDLEGRRGG
jgi:hypothetical protein